MTDSNAHEEWHRSRHCSWWPRVQQEEMREKREVAVTHFIHLMWIPAPPSSSPLETEPSVQAVMTLWGREDKWEIAAALRREEGPLREHGEESWCEIE